VLQEGEGEHRKQRVMMQPEPAPTFEVVEPEFFFQAPRCLEWVRGVAR
jgi:hypothetical protein